MLYLVQETMRCKVSFKHIRGNRNPGALQSVHQREKYYTGLRYITANSPVSSLPGRSLCKEIQETGKRPSSSGGKKLMAHLTYICQSLNHSGKLIF